MPHLLMRELAGEGPPGDHNRGGELAASVHAATACTGCGACSVMCPAELLPGAAVRSLGAALAERQAGTPAAARPRASSSAKAPSTAVPAGLTAAGAAPRSAPPGDRRVPLPLLLARLGLSSYVPPG